MSFSLMAENNEDAVLEEEILEINEVTAGRAPIQLPGRVVSIFPAFAHRNYQLYFSGQIISLIGFWLQVVGLGFLVFQMTHSAFWVGVVSAAGGLPTLFFTTFAGVLIDKVNKQNLVFWAQVLQTILALLLGIAVLSGIESIPLILLIAFLTGTVGAIDLPARQAFVVEMVGKKDLASAISTNIGTFNAARFVGPALAGLLIATIGVGWTFILNALSFLPVIFALRAVRPVYLHEPETDLHPYDSLKQGIAFVFTHERLVFLTLLAATTAFFVWPYQTLMPPIAERVFHAGASGLGSLLSAAGAGSLLGAIFTSTQTKRESRGKLIFAGAVIAASSLVLFSLNHNFALAHILLFFTGFGMITQVASINTTVQSLAPDQMRGRIMAVYLTMFVGFMPLGSAFAGVLAEKTSSLFTIGVGSSVLLLSSSFLYFKGYLK